MPLYCSAMGKIFLAWGSEEYLFKYWQTHQDTIQQLTKNTITTLPEMQQELKDILQQRTAMDREENELGVTCIAAPVFDIQQRVPYAVSVSLPTAKLQLMGTKNLMTRVVATAQAMPEELGSKV